MWSGLQTSFWEDPWLRNIPLKSKYPDLFSNSLKLERLVIEIWDVINAVLTWVFRWKRSFFLRELSVLKEFHVLLRDVILTLDRDKFIWKHSRNDTFQWLLFTLSSGRVSLLYGTDFVLESCSFLYLE